MGGTVKILLVLLCFTFDFTFQSQPRICPSYDPHFLDGTCSAYYSDPAAVLIEDVFSSLAEADCELANPCNYPPHYSPSDWEEFDFIVVGAGSAGSVVANRLTEIAGWTVLLIEAGGDPPKTAEVPALYSTFTDTEFNWSYLTNSEEPNCLGSVGGQCKWSGAKMLGGGSSHNALVYVRGNRIDFDGWEAEGNIGWGYRDVLPYFKKSENMRSLGVRNTPEFLLFHNTDGPLKVDDYNIENTEPIPALLASGIAEMGYGFNPDINGRYQSGFCRITGTIEDGRRCSTAKAFLTPIKYRPNLKVSKFSYVQKILIDKIERTAYGVEFVDKLGNVVRALARKEVIISGGVFKSPQLLILSGIGPREHLWELGIDVICDLPVGNNLQDQPTIFGAAIGLDSMIPEADMKQSMFKFLLKQNSTLSGIGIGPFLLFMGTETTKNDIPDIEVLFGYYNKNSSISQSLKRRGYNDEIINDFVEINKELSLITLSPILIDPKSRGFLRLRSRNPFENPKITTGYFSDPKDIDALAKAMGFLKDLVHTETFRAVGAKYFEVNLKACSKFPHGSRPYRECFLRHVGTTLHHYVGTCHMGPLGHPEAVVDPQLQVQGVARLRVIDASVMPKVTRGNTNAPTIMIAEKGSDLIKQRWLSTPYSGAEVFKKLIPPYPSLWV